MARIVVIANPNAARTRPTILSGIECVFRQAGWQCEIVETEGPGHAETLARDASSDGSVEVVATYGGDGTMIEAVTGMLETEIPVGLLAGGTGNVLAGNLRIPRHPLAGARTILSGRTRAIDLGRFTASGSQRYFAIACGAGFEARLMETSSQAKRKWGMGAYFSKGFKLLADLSNVSYRVTVDGVEHELPAATLTVANCEEIVPPIISMHGGIQVDDGLLDVLAVNARNAAQASAAVLKMVTRTTEKGSLITHLKGREITVETDAPQPTGLDGEIVGVTPFSATLIPGGLRVVVPG